MASTQFMSTQYMPSYLFRQTDTQNPAGYNIIYVAGHKKDGQMDRRSYEWTFVKYYIVYFLLKIPNKTQKIPNRCLKIY